jgi:hypothetical protein
METKSEKTYQVFLIGKQGEDVANFSNLSYEEAQDVNRKLLVTYVVQNVGSMVSIVEEKK